LSRVNFAFKAALSKGVFPPAIVIARISSCCKAAESAKTSSIPSVITKVLKIIFIVQI
jgi:hypothetical protein